MISTIEAFKLSYLVLQPTKTAAALRLREDDILSFSIEANAQSLTKTSTVRYQSREYDYLTAAESIRTKQKTSESSQYILKTDIEKVFDTKLIEESAAEAFANRWAFILEQSSGLIKLTTKLQAASIEVGSIIDIEHRKLFVRFGGSDHRRLVMVEKVTKDGNKVSIEAVDLSNAFNRVAAISETTNDFSSASNDERLYSGFITDEFGMISNDPSTFGSNLIF